MQVAELAQAYECKGCGEEFLHRDSPSEIIQGDRYCQGCSGLMGHCDNCDAYGWRSDPGWEVPLLLCVACQLGDDE